MPLENWQDYRYSAVVLSIYDGDTITVSVDLGYGIAVIQKLRLNRIDAPELRGESRPHGIAARDWLRQQIPSGSRVNLQTVKDDQEKYGRYLAEIYTEAGCVNDLMVHAGFAVYRKY